MMCCKLMPRNKRWQDTRIGGPRYWCTRPKGHKGKCGEWQWGPQIAHARALQGGQR